MNFNAYTGLILSHKKKHYKANFVRTFYELFTGFYWF